MYQLSDDFHHIAHRNAAGDACASAAGCVFTAATKGKCAESSSDSAFGLKTSFLLIFLYFFL